MNGRLLILVTSLISFGLGFFFQGLPRGNCSPNIVESSYAPKSEVLSPSYAPSSSKTPEVLEQYARSITVKVLSGENWGSGILIRQKDNIYNVLTNQHVLIFGEGKSYRIVTSDGKTYPAKLVTIKGLSHQDLGLLQFKSQKKYTIAILSSKVKPIQSEKVLAAGFPFDSRFKGSQGFLVNWGQIEILNTRSFGGGYQIGYSNLVKKGMSGGPLINLQGQVIGINGVHKYPLWGNHYVFNDGDTASPSEKQKMSQFSWAIPIQTFLEIAPQYLEKNTQRRTEKVTQKKIVPRSNPPLPDRSW